MAPIFAADTITSGDEAEVGDLLGVELEIGFRIVRDLPGDMAKMTAAQLIPYLKPVVVIELVDTRLAGHLAEDPVSKLADNQINAGLVIGETAEKWDGTDFGDVEARMQAGDDQLITGMASVPGGSALETVAALARQIGTHCGGLQKGQIVITGSLHPLTYYPAGTEVLGSIQSIGSVGVSLNGPPKKAA
ncbi:MAG: hydratase [Silicimonas sp.]|nr:hydratase [Silicimonas sp.]